VSQSKFTVLKIISRKNFSEFMDFFPKGLNPFKIQVRFTFELVADFIVQPPEGFVSWAKNEKCPF
jgi:hypothetical protein